MAKIITIVNRKGGCGKTTTTKNLGYSLAKKGYKVLLVDYDPQCNTTKGLSKRNYRKTVIDMMRGTDVRRCIYKTRYDMDILPGNQFLASEEIADHVITDQMNLILIPTVVEPDSLDGMSTTINELEELCDYDIKYKILFTQVNDLKSTADDVKVLDDNLDDLVFDTKIRFHRYAVKRARMKQQPLAKRYRRASVTRDYEKLANEIVREAD